MITLLIQKLIAKAPERSTTNTQAERLVALIRARGTRVDRAEQRRRARQILRELGVPA